MVYQGYQWGSGRVDNGIIQGVMICHAPADDSLHPQPCNAHTVFEITGSSVSFLPGKLFEVDLDSKVGAEIRRLFNEALLCFYGRSGAGTVAMCRSAIEEGLDDKGAKGRDLHEKIPDAKDRLHILGDEQVAQAHTARLIGRDESPLLEGAVHSPLNQSAGRGGKQRSTWRGRQLLTAYRFVYHRTWQNSS